MKNTDREIYKVNGKSFNAKINLDKYYTPVELAKYCIDKTYEIIGKENITEIIEPSAGNGSFSLQIPNCIAYDIEPEHESIIKQDFSVH
jgi:predicted RNA methylase